jgi:hypothetical protein
MGERLRLPKWSVMNLRFLKRMLSSREKTLLDRRSLLVVMASANDGTMGTSRGKARYKYPFLAR